MCLCLAEQWGVDLEKCLAAGLLHDLAKCLKLEDQRKKLEACTVVPAIKEDFEYKNVWHGKVAAQEAYDLFGINDPQILEAVAHHSTGIAGMSEVGLVLYIADFIEPSRDWNGAEASRASILSKEMIPAAHEVATTKLKHLNQKGVKPHSLTHQMTNWLNEITTIATN